MNAPKARLPPPDVQWHPPQNQRNAQFWHPPQNQTNYMPPPEMHGAKPNDRPARAAEANNQTFQ